MDIKLTVEDAMAHRSYKVGVHTAADRAHRDKGESFAVYWDGETIYVRNAVAFPPKDALIVCIAQHWDKHTVQLRFAEARSEWVHFDSNPEG